MDAIHLYSRAKGIAFAAGLYHCITILVLAKLYHTSSLNDMRMLAYRLPLRGVSSVIIRQRLMVAKGAMLHTSPTSTIDFQIVFARLR